MISVWNQLEGNKYSTHSAKRHQRKRRTFFFCECWEWKHVRQSIIGEDSLMSGPDQWKRYTGFHHQKFKLTYFSSFKVFRYLATLPSSNVRFFQYVHMCDHGRPVVQLQRLWRTRSMELLLGALSPDQHAERSCRVAIWRIERSRTGIVERPTLSLTTTTRVVDSRRCIKMSE